MLDEILPPPEDLAPEHHKDWHSGQHAARLEYPPPVPLGQSPVDPARVAYRRGYFAVLSTRWTAKGAPDPLPAPPGMAPELRSAWDAGQWSYLLGELFDECPYSSSTERTTWEDSYLHLASLWECIPDRRPSHAIAHQAAAVTETLARHPERREELSGLFTRLVDHLNQAAARSTLDRMLDGPFDDPP